MLGAIIGDIIGSVHEGRMTKTRDFPLFHPRATFTDDSVLTVAVADWILEGGDLVEMLHRYYAQHPARGYGGMFSQWASERRKEPYNSFGNGSAMRVSPVGSAFGSLDEVLEWSAKSAAVTHNHPEGIRGAQAIASAVYYARRIRNKEEIRELLELRFGYDLHTPLEEIRPHYTFDVTCQGSVPQAIRAFLESTSFEDAIRNAISLGGDADTLACMAGGIAEAYYGIPEEIAAEARGRLDPQLVAVVQRFRDRYHRTT